MVSISFEKYKTNMLYIFGAFPPVLAGFADGDLETIISHWSLAAVYGGIVAVLLLVGLVSVGGKHWPMLRPASFIALAVVVSSATLFLAASSISLSMQSSAGGRVHWQAAVEFWACGNELTVREPHGLSGFVGSPTLHQADDKLLHYDGTPVDSAALTLGSFVSAIGGQLTEDALLVPLNDSGYFAPSAGSQPSLVMNNILTGKDGKYARFINGQTCGDQTAEVQAYAYTFQTSNNTYIQHKLADPAQYVPSPASATPPGDCIVVEFGPAQDRTDKLCHSYGVRDQNRCGQFGVAADERKGCGLKEIL